MEVTGGCYCGALRYSASVDPAFKGQCHCRECQYISGGNPNVVIGFPQEGIAYTRGEPRDFFREELESPAHREFCEKCGTHILTRVPGMAIVKVGTLDDPSLFDKPQFAIQTADKQPWHVIPEGVPQFERWMD